MEVYKTEGPTFQVAPVWRAIGDTGAEQKGDDVLHGFQLDSLIQGCLAE